MKFNDGEWMLKPGVKCFNCEQIRSAHISEDGRLVKLLAVPYKEDRRVLDGPALEIEISTPHRDCLSLRLVHFRGGADKRPSFPLNDDGAALSVADEGGQIRISSGSLTLVITRRPASFRYLFDGRPLTGVGERFGSPMLSYLDTPDGPYMRARMSVDVGEKVYGLGERFTSFVKNGQTVDMWNADGGTSSELAYKNIPFYLTDRGCGVFVNDTGPVSFEVCTESTSDVQFSVPGQELDFTVIGGSGPKDVLTAYTALTGRPALPPAWSFGLWLTSSFTTSYDEKTVTAMTEGMRERDIPLSVFHFDCFWMREGEWCGFEWDRSVFPDPAAMIKRLKERGLHICVWINPYIGQSSPAFDLAKKKGFLLRRPDGSIWQWDLWQPGLAIIDFTNPAAVEWYRGELKKLCDMGVDAFKTDFGERIPTDCVWYDGSDPKYMHNYYSYLYNKTVFDLLEEVKGEGGACLFARSATAGSQAMPVHWGGDCRSDYPSMAESLRGGLSLCLSGFGFWSHDIGGFEGTATPDVYKRWCAFGLLSSHSRLHGSDSYRVPWLFGEEAVEVCRSFSKLKNRLMPYIFSLAVEAHKTGVPVMRAMLLEFDDPGARDCDMQYMLGDALLAAPVMNAAGRGVFYTPAGVWTHLLDDTVVADSGWHERHFDYLSLPLYVRENTILPIGAVDDTPEYDYAAGLTLYIYSLSEGSTAKRTVCDMKGKPILEVAARRVDGAVRIEAKGQTGGVSAVIVDGGRHSAPVCLTGEVTVIAPSEGKKEVGADE